MTNHFQRVNIDSDAGRIAVSVFRLQCPGELADLSDEVLLESIGTLIERGYMIMERIGEGDDAKFGYVMLDGDGNTLTPLPA